MVECTATVGKGRQITLYAENFAELAEELKKYEISELQAKVIRVSEMRQGKMKTEG